MIGEKPSWEQAMVLNVLPVFVRYFAMGVLLPAML